MLDTLNAFGQASGEVLWVPLLVWTALWLLAEAAHRLGARVHPLVRYRATQAVLFALPLGLALAPFLDPSRIAPWLNPPLIIDAAPLASALALPEAATMVTAAPVAPTLTAWGVLGLVVLALAALAGLRLVQVAQQAWTLHRLRRALPASDPALAPEARTLTRGLRRTVRAVATAAAPVPMTFGLWRPVVVLPDDLRGQARSLALQHELVHVRRWDALAAGAEALTAALFSFHPGVHRIARRCGLLRELACDAALLSRREVSRGAYAALVARFAAPAPLFAAVGISSSPSHVHQRIAAMTRPTPLLRRSTLALGWGLAATLLVGASLAVTTSRALAQEARIIVRSVDATAPVVIVDGVRQADGTSALSPEALANPDVYSVDVYRGEDAQARFGEDTVVEVTSKAEAAARGLPETNDAAFRIMRSASGGSLASDTVLVNLLRLREEIEPGMIRLHERLAPDMLRLSERMAPMLLELKEGLESEDSELRQLMERIHSERGRLRMDAPEASSANGTVRNFRLRQRASDPNSGDAPAVDIEFMKEFIEDGASSVKVRSRGGSLRIGPAVDLGGMKGLLTEDIESIEIKRDGEDRLVTITRKDGSVREARLPGPISTPVRVSDLAPAPKTARAPLAPVAAPNPASGAVTVRYAMEGEGTARLRVFDLTGRKVYERDVPRGETVQTHRVNISGLAAGGYIYRLEASGEATQTGRFTVAR